MDAGDEVSDSASVYSIDRSIRSVGTRGMAAIPRAAANASVAGSMRKQANVRPVSSLRPKVRFSEFWCNVIGWHLTATDDHVSPLQSTYPLYLPSGCVPSIAVLVDLVRCFPVWPPIHRCLAQPPLCLPLDYSVAQVAVKMAEVRTDAVILLGAQGDMRGIMTDQDVAR